MDMDPYAWSVCKICKGGQVDVGLLYSMLQDIDSIKFEFNNIIISLHYLYTKNDYDRGQSIILL